MTRSSGSFVRRSRLALGFHRFCADVYPRFAVFLRRPSSNRATNRQSCSYGSAFFRVPAGSPCPPPRAPLLGFRAPPCLHAFSAQRTGTFAVRRRHARGVSSRAGRRPTSPPEGLSCRRRWTLARHLSCASVLAAEVAGADASESASPSEVASSFEAAIPFEVLGSSSYRRENDTTEVAIAWQATHRLSTVAGARDCIRMSRVCPQRRKLPTFSPRSSTACGQRAMPPAMTRTHAARSAQSAVPRG